jgi:hypothetical protein
MAITYSFVFVGRRRRLRFDLRQNRFVEIVDLDPASFFWRSISAISSSVRISLASDSQSKFSPMVWVFARFLDGDQNLVALDAGQHALEALAPVDGLVGFQPRLVAFKGRNPSAGSAGGRCRGWKPQDVFVFNGSSTSSTALTAVEISRSHRH